VRGVDSFCAGRKKDKACRRIIKNKRESRFPGKSFSTIKEKGGKKGMDVNSKKERSGRGEGAGLWGDQTPAE